MAPSDSYSSAENAPYFKPLIGGALALSVAMGIGRFAYTPMLPVMEHELHLSVSSAGSLASINYIGYLLGALIAAWLPLRTLESRFRLIAASLLCSVVTTGFMAMSESFWIWAVLRGFGGLFSALILVCCSSAMMDWLSHWRQSAKVGIFYAGVGIGITVTGVSVPLFTKLGGWQTGWYGLGIVSFILTLCSLFLLSDIRKLTMSGKNRHVQASESGPSFRLWGITAAYGLEGLGYIVMGTFVTVFFSQASSLPWLGNVSWILVGCSAVPSTWLWSYAARSWGMRNATYAAFLVQAAGIILPTLVPGVSTAIVGSVLFGGTFMGITTLALTIGRQIAPGQSGRTIGNLTAIFGIGQVIGPVGAGLITDALHSYSAAMLLSGVLLLIATVLLRVSQTSH